MKKIVFFLLMPVWLLYILFGIIVYVLTKDDKHFTAMSDFTSWWMDGDWNT